MLVQVFISVLLPAVVLSQSLSQVPNPAYDGDEVKMVCVLTAVSAPSYIDWAVDSLRFSVDYSSCAYLGAAEQYTPEGCNSVGNEHTMKLTIASASKSESGQQWVCSVSPSSSPIISIVIQDATTPGTPEDCCTVEKWCNILPIIGAIFVAIGILLNIIPLVLRKLESIKKKVLVKGGRILCAVGLILIIIGLIGGLFTDCCTKSWRIALLCVAVILIIILGVYMLYMLGYLPGRWSDTVLIPEKDYPRIKFEEVLSWVKRKKIMEETEASIFICGEGSDKYEKTGGQDACLCLCLMSLPDNDQPLQAYVTACLKIRVKRAVLKIRELHEAFTTQSVIAAVHEPTYKAVNSVEPRPLPEPKGPPATRLQPIPPKM